MKKEQDQPAAFIKGTGRARMFVAAIIGSLLLNPPLLEIFSVDPAVRVLGWPLILFYINLIWILLILMVLMPQIGSLLKTLRFVLQRVLGRRSV